ncbi:MULTISPECIES: leucine-rich repeat domain-containing protein [Capnocytophaga]|uniref:leucine-rich repeat domain-containing protein n=1 Tax=Capnocytophaga TaxID=1016 RepID=UPI00020C5CE9|nr:MULTISPECIES: leucine-rich repeat domain-containing protein [unclassified Capnocytophaga]KHE71128.1 bacterial group 2 Ig-like protein [Capnocytophaga sp. oral taxon 329 str. F0087]QGS18526.1 leucine-rich repeat protein [Capnocytophaga sp. FDAARGOS_737]
MKNLRFLTVGLALIALLFTACKKDDNGADEQAPKQLTLEKSAVTVKLTESAIVRITSGNGDYKVESADKSIATAAIEQTNVKITAVAEGQTTLTVADVKGQKATIAVTIESNIAPSERLSVENKELNLVNGEDKVNRILNAKNKGARLSFTITPAGSVTITVEDRIVNGTPEGENLRIKALSVGTAQVSVKDNADNQTTTFKVIVSAAELTVAKTDAEVEAEATTEIRINTGNPDYTVTSSAATIATAEVKDGTRINHLDTPHKAIFIKGLAAGTATITLKDSQNKTIAIAVTVKAKNDIFEVDGSGVVTLKAGATAKGAITIPTNATAVGQALFRSNLAVTSVNFSNVIKIGASACFGTTNLTSITLNKVEEIEATAFANSGLTELTLPATIKTIARTAFANCKGLTKVTVKATTPPTVQANTFNGINANAVLYVPKGKKADYEAQANWKSKFKEIRELN